MPKFDTSNSWMVNLSLADAFHESYSYCSKGQQDKGVRKDLPVAECLNKFMNQYYKINGTEFDLK